MAKMAAQGQRSGKFRHIFGKADKNFHKDIKNPLTSGEGTYLACNHKFFAVAKSSGGGPVYIRNINDTGRFPANAPVLSVHKGKCLDMDFHPFIPNMIATVSEDCSVAVSQFPKEGLVGNVTESVTGNMKGHGKKVALCTFNPSAMSILASGSFDRSIKIWNIEKKECIQTYKGLKDNIYSLEWNFDGSQIAATSKDKKLHIMDPRMSEEAACTQAFEGTKSSKCFWLQNLGWIGSCGFSKQAKRMIKMWDLKDLSKPIFELKIDQAASVLMPYYDNDLGILYTFGKGDGTVSWGEVINDSKKYYSLGQFRDNVPQKGGGFVSKRGLDVWKCEVGKFLKLTAKDVIPIPLVCPRKSGADVFQEDIYPDCYAGKAAITADEWEKGNNADPKYMSMNPDERKDDDDGDAEYVAKKTYAELEEENEQLRNRITELEAQVKELGGDAGGDAGGDDAGGDGGDGGDYGDDGGDGGGDE